MNGSQLVYNKKIPSPKKGEGILASSVNLIII